VIIRRSLNGISGVSRYRPLMYVDLVIAEGYVLSSRLQYRGWDPDKAVEDYYIRIRDHEKYYESVEETNWPFIKIINVKCSFFFAEILMFISTSRSVRK
jgi:hypothetical protein